MAPIGNGQLRALADERPNPAAQPAPHDSQRLDSWKAIATYLNRDERTVRRWEREFGLPIRRLAGGRGRSVYAYSTDIDAWLQAGGTERPVSTATPSTDAAPGGRRWMLWAGGVVLIVAVLATGLVRSWRPPIADGLHVENGADGVRAVDRTGTLLWKYTFPPEYETAVLAASTVVATGATPAVYAFTHVRTRLADRSQESGILMQLQPRTGRLERSFTFDDRVDYLGKQFGPPWAMTAISIDDSTGLSRVAVAAHHAVWEPSVVTVLDDRWRRVATLVHPGWIEGLRWTSPDRLLIAGFSNERNGGTLALLNPTSMKPVKIVVMPRTELNRATGAPFNRAQLQVMPNRILARTIEIPAATFVAADAIYEFTPDLDLIGASFGDHYWELHEALQAQGTVTHGREQCPDKTGPRTIQVWTPASGWRTPATVADQKPGLPR